MKRLAEAGGDVSATAADNVSCLHFACQKGSADAVAELLAAKAGAHFSSPSPWTQFCFGMRLGLHMPKQQKHLVFVLSILAWVR